MASATSGNDSVAEGLKKVFTQVANLQLLPDGPQHAQFIQLVQQAIIKYLQQQANQTLQSPMGAPGQDQGGAPGMGGPPGMGAAPPAAQFGPGGAAGGGMPGLNTAPNPDELQRVLSQQGAGG